MAAALELAGDRFPAILGAIAEAPRDAGAHQRDAALEFGIQRILDGVAVLLAERSGTGA